MTVTNGEASWDLESEKMKVNSYIKWWGKRGAPLKKDMRNVYDRLVLRRERVTLWLNVVCECCMLSGIFICRLWMLYVVCHVTMCFCFAFTVSPAFIAAILYILTGASFVSCGERWLPSYLFHEFITRLPQNWVQVLHLANARGNAAET